MPIDPLNSQNWTTESTAAAGSSANSSPSPSGGGCKPPIQQCTCCCNCNDGVEGEIETAAESNALPSTRTPIVSAPELTQHSSGGSGMDLGEGLKYSGDGSGAGSGQNGEGWVNPHQPMLRFDSGNVFVESGPVETVRYTPDGGGFKPDYFNRDILAYDQTTERYTLTSQKGKRQVFSKGGRLEKIIDAYGNETVLTYALDDTLISMVTGTGADTVGYFYTYTTIAGKKRVTSVVMRVGGATDASDYRRIVYSFTSAGLLEKVVVEEIKDGDWLEIETAYYRYYSTPGKRLWFVVNDQAYEQMHSVNPSWPEGASDAEVSQYADVEYAYQSDGRISQAKTHGGKYTYAFTSAENSPGWAQGPGVWRSKTTVAMPDGSTQTFYFNEALSLLLKKVSEPQPDGSVNVWYPVCQQFDGIMRITLSAPSSAVVSFNESTPTLFGLRPDDGALKIFDYDENGNRSLIALKKGAHGTLVNQQTLTYTGRTVAGDTIYVPETVTEYRDASDSSASNPVTTSYAYTWFAETFQVEKVTATLPAVPNSENGDNATGTTTTTFDEYGFVVEQVDAVDMKNTYEYDVATGALKRTVEDAGRLDLTTDYEIDPLGRTVRTLGPVHTISLDGVATEIRRAQWTQYLDSDDEVRTFSGYVKTSDDSEHCVNPIQITRHFVTDPEVSGGRMEESISAVYSGSGIPTTATSFPQSSYVRLSTQHFSSKNELTHSRLYHLIPGSGLGTNGTNYAQTSFGYDSAGRQNKTTSPEGTISLASYNAMGWSLRSQTGTADANLVTVSTSEYDANGNVTKATNMVDGTTANDRVSYFRYDWRDRQTETDASDGTVLIRTRRTYDNRGNVTQADEYTHSYASASLINRAESFFDGRNRQYRTKRYGVEVGTGTLQPALTSEIYFDQAGRTVRNTPAGKVGFSVVEYDTAGRTQEQFRAWGGTLDLAAPGDISTATVIEQSGFHYDDAGNSTYISLRQRFDNATGAGALQDPSNEPKARVSYVATYPDALGRTVATANYGTNGGAAWTRPATIPARSDTVLVSSAVFNDAGEQEESTDPMGTVTRREFDAAGRMVKLIENYQP